MLWLFAFACGTKAPERAIDLLFMLALLGGAATSLGFSSGAAPAAGEAVSTAVAGASATASSPGGGFEGT